MGQGQSNDGRKDVTDESLRRSQNAIEKLFDSMQSTGTSAPRTFIALPSDVQPYFKEDFDGLMATRELISRMKRQPERMRGQVTHNMAEAMDSALDTYERVFTQYMKTTTLALKIVPALNASMDVYFKAVARRLAALEAVTGRFRKEMEQVASPVTALDGDGKAVRSAYSDILKTTMDERPASVTSARKDLQKVQKNFQENLKTWSAATATT
jgi:ATP phosphoribosyltransferase regulatory subunit HisZ